ncbi:unnamed protein product [Strongylus vulgaris]|uniref:FH2 domain-containing protein n=1 Tax=Strongylus vulgaris TaxID=40348 RepID=A0A3P7ITQ5_STRVU|nr:unnamed protein product [Strongylus vulgaris]
MSYFAAPAKQPPPPPPVAPPPPMPPPPPPPLPYPGQSPTSPMTPTSNPRTLEIFTYRVFLLVRFNWRPLAEAVERLKKWFISTVGLMQL